MYEVPIYIDVYTLADLSKLIKADRTILEGVAIRGERLDSLVGVEKITGKLLIMDSMLQSLGELREVGSDFYIGSRSVHSPLQSLGKLEKVGGDLGLRYSNVTDLGNLKWVEGNVSLRDTAVQDMGALEYVGGNLLLPKRLKGQVDLSHITVKGKISYWNDNKERKAPVPKSELGLLKSERPVPYWEHQLIYSQHDLSIANSEQQAFYRYFKDCFLNGKFIDVEGNLNYAFFLFFDLVRDYKNHQDLNKLQNQLFLLGKYYPRTEKHTLYELFDLSQEEQDYESAWELRHSGIKSGIYGLQLYYVCDFQQKLGRKLLDGDLIVKYVGPSCLTEFGQRNIDPIKLIAVHFLEEFEEEKGEFFSVFYKITYGERNRLCLDSYEASYYRPFYKSEEEFEIYKAYTISQFGEISDDRVAGYVADRAIRNQFRLFLQMAEDQYRESCGMPRVGEGWISETELFYKVVKAFPQYKIIQHGSPRWLGNQHLDIYMPAVNIGIEYQGPQHYEPVDYFGGEDAFVRTAERDRRKRRKCEENHCVLLYVNEEYNFEELRLEIERIIQDKQG